MIKLDSPEKKGKEVSSLRGLEPILRLLNLQLQN
jgi:hypothetical protein